MIPAQARASPTRLGYDIESYAAAPVYLRRPFSIEPDFAVTSVNYDTNQLLARAGGKVE